MAQPEPYKLEQELNLLEPESVKLYLNDFEDLILEIDGSAREVVPYRAFPLTGADQFIALRNTDDEEIGMIRNSCSNPGRHRIYRRLAITRGHTVVA